MVEAWRHFGSLGAHERMVPVGHEAAGGRGERVGVAVRHEWHVTVVRVGGHAGRLVEPGGLYVWGGRG